MAIVQLDTLILVVRAFARRVSLLGVSQLFARARGPDQFSVLYLDLGTPKQGAELKWMAERVLPRLAANFEAIGFEANNESYGFVSEHIPDSGSVRVIHAALCHILPEDGKVRLHKDTQGGLGDSLYRETASYDEVEALRLSDFLREHDALSGRRIILLRMNIEGAEFDVIKDLVDSGLASRIDGYFGMWDDLSKIDLQRDEEFRAFLEENRIVTFPFNGRDMGSSARKACIAYHVHTQVLARLADARQGVARERQNTT